MTKFVANLGLVVLGLLATLGNYWFTFGLWPQSWLSFFGFGLVMMLLMVMRLFVEKDKA